MCTTSSIDSARRHSTERRGPAPLTLPRAAAAILLLWSAGSIPAGAQEATEPVPMYRVELLVFEMPGDARRPEDPGPPPLPPEPQLPVLDPPVDGGRQASPPAGPPPGQPEEIAGALPTTQEEDPAAFFFEPVEPIDLDSMADALGRRDGYRVLVHEAWRQPGFARVDAMTLDLETVGRLRARMEFEGALARGLRPPAPESPVPPVGTQDGAPGSAVDDAAPGAETLTATARLWRGRYLHLEIDTVLTRETRTMRLSESRRMRSGELHYFDSPNIGAIAVVVPDEGDVETEENEPGPALPAAPVG
jgi:hypothetical protein